MKNFFRLNNQAGKFCIYLGIALTLAGCGNGGSPAPVVLNSITVTPDPVFIGTGTTLNLTATANYSDGAAVDVTSRTTWSSADPLTASLGSTTGVLTAASAVGATTTITATFNGVSSHAVNVTITSAGSTSSKELTTARFDHAAALLNDGRVLVTGGYGISGAALASTELYDPATGLWTNATGSLVTARGDIFAVTLGNGKVLVAGGVNSESYDAPNAELYDPAGQGTWTETGPLVTPRSYHTLTLLADGTALLVGGSNSGINKNTLGLGIINNAEIYDPVTNNWSATASLSVNRYSHTATLLQNGQVLVAGGFGGADSATTLNGAELFQPPAGATVASWTATGSLHKGRYSHTATLLNDGTVLVAGGVDAAGNDIDSSELFDPGTGTWTVVGKLNSARFNHRAILMPSGQVLVMGGANASSANLDSAELYDPITKTWSYTGNLQTGRVVFTATLLANGSPSTDGKVLIVGGDGAAGTLSNVELHN